MSSALRRAALFAGPGLVLAALVSAGALAAPVPGRAALGVNPRDPKITWVWLESRGLFTTADGGETWVAVTSPRLVYRITFAPAGDAVWLATDDGVLKSADGGKTWTRAAVGKPGSHVVDLVVLGDPPRVFAVGEEGVYKSADGGKTFRNAGVPGQAFHLYRLRASPKTPRQIVVASPTLLYRSDDAGDSWARQPAPPDVDFAALVWGVGEPPSALAGVRTGVYFSTDGGASWKQASPDVAFVRALWAPNPSNPKLLLVATVPWASARPDDVPNAKILEKGLFRTTDAGKSWSRNLTPDGGAVVDLAFAPSRPEFLWVVTELKGVFNSPNGGDSWKAVTPPAP